MSIRFLIRFVLLTLGFALTTLGILAWQQMNFDLNSLWPIAAEFTAQVLGTTEQVWGQVFPEQLGREYRPPVLVFPLSFKICTAQFALI